MGVPTYIVTNPDQVTVVAGSGVPAGGTTGQVLTKTSNADYAAAWETPVAGNLPAYPTADGTYSLALTVTGGVGVLSWASGVSPPPPPPPPVTTASLDFTDSNNSMYYGSVV